MAPKRALNRKEAQRTRPVENVIASFALDGLARPHYAGADGYITPERKDGVSWLAELASSYLHPF